MSEATLTIKAVVTDKKKKLDSGVPDCNISIKFDSAESDEAVTSLAVIMAAYKIMQTALEVPLRLPTSSIADMSDKTITKMASKGDEVEIVLLKFRELEHAIADAYGVPQNFIDRIGRKGCDY